MKIMKSEIGVWFNQYFRKNISSFGRGGRKNKSKNSITELEQHEDEGSNRNGSAWCITQTHCKLYQRQSERVGPKVD